MHGLFSYDLFPLEYWERLFVCNIVSVENFSGRIRSGFSPVLFYSLEGDFCDDEKRRKIVV